MLCKYVVMLLLLTAPAAPAGSQERSITIGTAGQSNLSYFLGQQICQLMSLPPRRHGYECSAPATGGSVANIEGLRNGEIDVALVRSDWLRAAVAGEGAFRDQGPATALRSLFSAHVEVFAVVARADSSIRGLGDLKGKRINLGPAGEDARQIFERLMGEARWRPRDFAVAAELKPAIEDDQLCRARIDAIFQLGVHPSTELRELANACEVVVVPLEGAEIDRLTGQSRHFVRASIPAGLYRGVAKEVASLGLAAAAVATDKTDAAMVYELVRAVFEHMARLRRAHPAFARLEPRRMIADGLTAPLHPGALRYYQEKGWIK